MKSYDVDPLKNQTTKKSSIGNKERLQKPF